MALLDVFDSQLTRREASASGSAGEVLGTNPNGTVRVRMTNEGALLSVDFDRAWLAAAEHGRIALAIRDALRDAQHRSAPLPREPAGSSPAAAELRRLTEQPEVLLRKLGLIR
ncbi:YbaB/EbfC family nucleoid-associated protein [Micromonospora sp. AP08]|uniref:YbaB/EbfC family nucleoid-associated protein n=1 Tax=Micromonospora sp. AP08 TaxID=2604467 RepID=UPI0011DC3B24|nr:YbaB/EbfC family nucleoid-associated protein [Micromonospora sp. AP08]TYB39756.1 YbaB/EbfC family nucleoid-associated protein [Micromonospora sp. AP08]